MSKHRTTSPRGAEDGSPSQAGFRLPAEWEPQDAIWLSWPHRLKTWPGHFRPIPAKFAEIVAAISRFEDVRINVPRPLRARAKHLCERAGAAMNRVRFFNHPTDDSWCRDHGPIFVRNDTTGEVALTDWKFNAWGEKYPAFACDDAIPSRVASALHMRRFASDMVLEGGSIDVNGAGSLLTTEACLLNPNRNPHLSRERIEQQLRAYLGVKDIVWLGAGIVGDDTDGHVDDLARFFKVDGIVTAIERNGRDLNFRALRENRERLDELRTPDGRRFDVRELPMPAPCVREGRRMPASYANFLVINGAVLVPTFQQPRRDALALDVIGTCFPDREVVGIDCLDLVWGCGTLHCISQQQSA